MTTLEKITKLRAYALTAKTAIYNEDAMTAIQLAGVTACKVNECIDAINGMLEICEEVFAEILKHEALNYDDSSEELLI